MRKRNRYDIKTKFPLLPPLETLEQNLIDRKYDFYIFSIPQLGIFCKKSFLNF